MKPESAVEEYLDQKPEAATFENEVLEGLAQAQKSLPCKYLYDTKGSQLFDQICDLDDYYPTRTETELLRNEAPSIATTLGPHVALIELGSGSSRKTHLLLDALEDTALYAPIDISEQHLLDAVERIASAYPDLHVQPICADFTSTIDLPDLPEHVSKRVVFFPGSTLGNFAPKERESLLRGIHRMTQPEGGGLLLGVDLIKDTEILERAYNDSEGVTAEFNLNVLRHINRELSADFDLEKFVHKAVFNPEKERVEMHLESLTDQTVNLAGQSIPFRKGETIHTENSHKFRIASIAKLAEECGFSMERMYTDEKKHFALLWLQAVKPGNN